MEVVQRKMLGADEEFYRYSIGNQTNDRRAMEAFADATLMGSSVRWQRSQRVEASSLSGAPVRGSEWISIALKKNYY